MYWHVSVCEEKHVLSDEWVGFNLSQRISSCFIILRQFYLWLWSRVFQNTLKYDTWEMGVDVSENSTSLFGFPLQFFFRRLCTFVYKQGKIIACFSSLRNLHFLRLFATWSSINVRKTFEIHIWRFRQIVVIGTGNAGRSWANIITRLIPGNRRHYKKSFILGQMFLQDIATRGKVFENNWKCLILVTYFNERKRQIVWFVWQRLCICLFIL